MTTMHFDADTGTRTDEAMPDDAIRYSRGRNTYDASPEQRVAADFDAFEAAFLADRSAKKGQTFVCSAFRINGDGRPHRGKDEALPRAFLPFDLDSIPDADTFNELRQWFTGYRGFGYTTASHLPDAPRCRIVLAADRAMTRDEGKRACLAMQRRVERDFGLGVLKFDENVYRAEQPLFTPLHGAMDFRFLGEPVKVDELLAEVPPDAEPGTAKRNEPGAHTDWLAALLEGDDVHGNACRLIGRWVALRWDDATIRATMDALAIGVAASRGRERADELLGEELDRMIDGARRNGYDKPREAPGAAQTGAEDAEHQRGSDRAAEGADEPQNLFREAVAPRFDPADVPAPIRRMAEAFSAATGFNVSGSIMAATVAAAAVIDDRYRLAVRPGSDWFESARLWAVLIGTPSAGKSPTIRAAADPIKDLHREMFARWLEANATAKEGERDPKPALFTSDATTEALADLLRDNPRGVLMLTEEFASWIGGIDAYRDGAGARNRGEWLQLYDGGPHQVDRVKRGSFLVPNWGASVLAACTPAGLRDQVRKLPDDGLIHRFMPCIMGAPRMPSATSARDALRDWSIRLRDLFERTTCETASARTRISTAARMTFDAEARAIRESIDAIYDLSPALASHLGKHPGMLARVALTFHLVDGRPGDAIERDTMERAARFMHTVRKHAAALFLGILSAAPALDVARGVARAIVADPSRPASIGRNYMTQRCRAFRQAQDFERRLAVQALEDARWLHPVAESRAYGGWGASEWAVNQRVFDLFAAEGEAHRDRRQAVRDFMGET